MEKFLVTAHMAAFPQPSPVYACALPEAPSPKVNEGNFARGHFTCRLTIIDPLVIKHDYLRASRIKCRL